MYISNDFSAPSIQVRDTLGVAASPWSGTSDLYGATGLEKISQCNKILCILSQKIVTRGKRLLLLLLLHGRVVVNYRIDGGGHRVLFSGRRVRPVVDGEHRYGRRRQAGQHVPVAHDLLRCYTYQKKKKHGV